jgi:[ribosomal protein S5]-alanine N-acetyltransferase
MITAPDTLLTPRLRLSRPAPGDAGDIFRAYAQDPEATRYLPWRPDGTHRQVEEHVAASIALWEKGASFAWSIRLREGGTFVGTIEARVDAYMVNVSYVIARAAWNRGYATESVRAVCAWAGAEPDVFRIWAVCAADNPASLRVLEKAGMTKEGLLRRWTVFPNIGGAPVDCFSYACVREPARDPLLPAVH